LGQGKSDCVDLSWARKNCYVDRESEENTVHPVWRDEHGQLTSMEDMEIQIFCLFICL